MNIKFTEAFELAYRFVTETNLNIFLTGKAGTGKTTFLKYLRSHSAKRMVIAAPTGVAAINAGGVTLHSLFQLPFAPYIPSGKPGPEFMNRHSLLSQIHYQKDKLQLFRNLDLLVIDECSMVASHMVDAIDTILRSVRRRLYEPFGGVQVLFIGDLFQLPPVMKDKEWAFLKNYYPSIFFFDSNVLREHIPVMVELKEIFRQQDDRFIEILNQIRNNELSVENAGVLNSRLQRNFVADEKDKFITLTTHNAQSDELNRRKLRMLDQPSKFFEAEIRDNYPEHLYPAESRLELKQGAQVMFLKNDPDGKKYFNGKIGTISRLEKDSIKVICPGETQEIDVRKYEWKNINYALDGNSHIIREEELGSFRQYPLRLAWAITIHKSQGLTFDKLIIDAENAFANGQVYVALSRCTSLDGLVLTSPVNQQFLGAHRQLKEWQEKNHDDLDLLEKFKESRKYFAEKELLRVFQWKNWEDQLSVLKALATIEKDHLEPGVFTWLDEQIRKQLELESLAEKFRGQLMKLLRDHHEIEENDGLQKRIQEGAAYFNEQIVQWTARLKEHPFTISTKKASRKIDEQLEELMETLNEILLKTNHCKNGFRLNEFIRECQDFSGMNSQIKSAYVPGAKKIKAEPEKGHPDLYELLCEMRKRIASEKHVPLYGVFSNNAMQEVCNDLPITKNALLNVKGFGDAKVKQYGDEITKLVKEYCDDHQLEPVRVSKKPAAIHKISPTVETSVELFRQYKNAEAVAKERNLVTGTIESHLSEAIRAGLITIDEVMPRPELESILQKIKAQESLSLTTLKDALPREITFGKLRIVLAWIQQEKKNSVAAKSGEISH